MARPVFVRISAPTTTPPSSSIPEGWKLEVLHKASWDSVQSTE